MEKDVDVAEREEHDGQIVEKIREEKRRKKKMFRQIFHKVWKNTMAYKKK